MHHSKPGFLREERGGAQRMSHQDATYIGAVLKTSVLAASVITTPHSRHSNVCNSGSPPSAGIDRVNRIGLSQFGQRGVDWSVLMSLLSQNTRPAALIHVNRDVCSANLLATADFRVGSFSTDPADFACRPCPLRSENGLRPDRIEIGHSPVI